MVESSCARPSSLCRRTRCKADSFGRPFRHAAIARWSIRDFAAASRFFNAALASSTLATCCSIYHFSSWQQRPTRERLRCKPRLWKLIAQAL
jgi:hypothetical protein